MDLGGQVLRSRLNELALVLNGTSFFVEEERGAQVDDFQGADRLRLLVVLDYYVIRFQVTVYDRETSEKTQSDAHSI